MPTTYTAYDDAVAYEAAIAYDGIVVTADTTPTETGNRHSAIWRPQRGRSHTFRRAPEKVPTFSGVHHRAAPVPEVTVSKTIEKIILAPERAEAEAKILEFVKNRNQRQESQPPLPEATPAVSYIAPPALPVEDAGERAHKRLAEYQRRERDDNEVLTLVSLLEGF
jgi:hypothetical protein